MPLLSSFGGGSARGFGVFRLMSGGTEGIFALGYNDTTSVATRDKYTYAGDVVSAATASSVASYSGSAAGNGTTGVNI